MVDNDNKKTDGHRKGSMVSRILTIILALIIAGGVGYAALNWSDLSNDGKICSENGKCVTIAPGKTTDVKKAS